MVDQLDVHHDYLRKSIANRPDLRNGRMRQGPIRVALVGCGAISRQMHFPVLAGHKSVNLVALVDRDLSRASECAKIYGVSNVFADTAPLDQTLVDAVVLATPPSHHAQAAIELMRRGLHVLVEKPMAINYADALAMVRTAEEQGVALAVGVFRRLLPTMQLAKWALESRLLGRPVGFDVEEGGFYDWAAATLTNMRRDLAGGGVLIDFGSHTFDRLFHLFPGPAEVLEYRDNSLGGIEADCVIRLRMHDNHESVEGRVILSRTRKQANRFRIRCEQGTIEWQSTDRFLISIRPDSLEKSGSDFRPPRDYRLELAEAGQTDESWYETFSAEIDDWLGAIQTGKEPRLSGRSVLPTVKLIEDCYQQTKPLEEPWVQAGFDKRVSPATVARKRRVLVTGATGFIGSRVAEVLALREGWDVRAVVHSPGKAARLARLPVEMVMADLHSEQEIARAVEGCDAVVHCAIGSPFAKRSAMFDVTVGGTRRLAAAALAHNVSRFVHISTFAVHDLKIKRTLDESTPIRATRGDDYADSKIDAEQAIADAVQKGLSAAILRPGCVYGPFSTIFTTRPLQYLAQGQLALLGSPDAPSSTVYVDNVVQAIVLALEAPDQQVKGEVFIITDGDDMSWGDFYGYFARALGVSLQKIPAEEIERRQAQKAKRGFMHWAATPYRSARDVATSPEMWAITKRVLKTELLYGVVKGTLNTFPSLERGARRLLKMDDTPIYHRPPAPPAESPFEFQLLNPLVNIEKARRVLNYSLAVPRPRALELTLAWARYAGVVP
jgi:predicted dehydrogenase/nucleoside-diphosphate-sugar epimerase